MAFTVIDANTSWQDLAIAKEIRTAYNKRRSACNMSLMDEPSDTVTVSEFILAVQSGIEDMATWFSNPASTLSGQSSMPSNYASLSAFMSAAGLTASGYWRRIADDGTQPETWTNYSAAGWSYGKIQDLDLAGPWLFQDIMTALSAMKRRVFILANYVTYKTYANADFGSHSSGLTSDVEASGSVSPTTDAVNATVGPGTMPVIYAYKCKTESGTYVDQIILSFNAARFRAAIFGAHSTVTFVGMIASSSSSAFQAFTGLSDSLIGKTFTRVTTDIGSGYANCWLWDPPSVIDDHTWAELSAALPSSSVPASDDASREMSISDQVCVVDYSFNP